MIWITVLLNCWCATNPSFVVHWITWPPFMHNDENPKSERPTKRLKVKFDGPTERKQESKDEFHWPALCWIQIESILSTVALHQSPKNFALRMNNKYPILIFKWSSIQNLLTKTYHLLHSTSYTNNTPILRAFVGQPQRWKCKLPQLLVKKGNLNYYYYYSDSSFEIRHGEKRWFFNVLCICLKHACSSPTYE